MASGYALLDDRTHIDEKLYFFKDYSSPSYEIVSKVPFSREDKDVVLLRNGSNWLVKIERHNGEAEFVMDPSVTLVSMENRTEHGIGILMLYPISSVLFISEQRGSVVLSGFFMTA